MRVLGLVLAGLIFALATAPIAAAAQKADPWAGIVPVVPAEPAVAHASVDPKASPEEVADLATIKPILDHLAGEQPNWQGIDIAKAAGREYSLILWYRDDVDVRPAQADIDSEFLVRSCSVCCGRRAGCRAMSGSACSCRRCATLKA